MPETTPPETSTTEAAQPAQPAEVVVRYRYADGILLEGETFAHKDAIKQARPRWRWFRSIRKWGVPRTRERSLSSYQVEQHANGLTQAGVPNVRVDYEEPRPEDVREFGEVLEERSERALERADRLEQRADRLEGQAAEEHAKGRAIVERMWPGQPILVGHHSEGRHRRDLERSDSAMRKSIEATKGAESARRRSEAAKHSVAKQESPRFALRRVLELAKEARGIEVNLTGEAPSGWRGDVPRGPATGEWRARLLTAAEENRQKAAYYRRVLDEAGYVPGDSGVLRVGDRVITDKYPGEVRKLLSQLVEIRFDRNVRVTMGGGRPDNVQRLAYDRVWVAKSVVEGRTSAPVQPARAASVKAPAPTSDLQAIASKHGFTDARVGDGRMLHAALVEAERLGEGARMARYFLEKKHFRAEDMQRALGRARGVVALENGTWPPPPLRGNTYGKQGFLGLLYSLQRHPVIVELDETARAWPGRMMEIAGGRYDRWFPRMASLLRRFVSDYADSYMWKLSRGELPTAELARSARDRLVENAGRHIQDLRETLDPALYDPKSSPEDVYPRLCKINVEAAKMILHEVFKVDFESMTEALALCNGRTTLAAIAEGAEQREEIRAVKSAEGKTERKKDARALVDIYSDASQRGEAGEMTPRRFNLTYWRRHPEIRPFERRTRALTVTKTSHSVEATVRGPNESWFYVRLPAGSEEQAAIAALLRELEQTAETRARTSRVYVGGGRRARRAVPFLDANKSRPKATKEPEIMKEPEPKSDPATVTEPARARSDAAPGSLWTVEEEGFALVGQPGDGTRVHVPTEHQPPLFDVGKPDPVVLEQLRAEELAERRAKRPPPDTSDPLLERAANDPHASATPTRVMLPIEAWAGEIQTIASEATPADPRLSERTFVSTVWKAVQGRPELAGDSMEAFKARLVEANRRGLLRLHRADLANHLDRTQVRDSEIQYLTATFHFIETPPRTPKPVPQVPPAPRHPAVTRPRSSADQVRSILSNRIDDDGPNGVSEFSSKHEPRMVRAAKEMAKRGEVKLLEARRGYVRIMAGPKWKKETTAPTTKKTAKATPEGQLSENARKTLDHARRVFASSFPARDPFTLEPKPPLFAALDPDTEAGAQELVAAGLLAPAPGSSMWGYYIDPNAVLASPTEAVAELAEPTQPVARLEYVDVATGVPADPSEPGTLATGRIVAELEGETVEIDREDIAGGKEADPRKRRFRFDLDGPVDYLGHAQAKKAARQDGGKKGKRKTAGAGLRATFDSAAKAAAVFYEHNEDFFDHVTDPWDGLRDWMDGVEVRVGRGHRKLSKTVAGRKILGEKHAARAIRGALAYSMGKAKGRRWEAVPWVEVDRLGEALARYFEAPSSGASQAGIYWRPFTGEVRAEDLDAMTPDQRAAIREQESVREIGEHLDELRAAYERAKGCMPEDLRRVIERRIGEWSRWVEDPSQIPDYACEPDPKTAGYLCNYPAVAGELAQLRRSCDDAYDPNWAAAESKRGAPGYPDTSAGEDESPPSRTASAKACCSTALPKAKNATKTAPSSPPATAKTTTKAKAKPTPKAAPTRTPKPAPARTVGQRKKSLADRKKEVERRRKLTAAERRAQRLTCSAAVAMRQVLAIDTVSYRRRVEDAAASIKKAEEHVKHHERDLKATMRDADTVMRARDSMPMDREIARRKVREARCQLRMAQGALRQRKRDHQRAQTELQRALTRVNKREAVAAKRQGAADKAKAEANVLRPDEISSPSSRR